jgi:uncharacterized membrane protein HdeD (DUF308 family)
MMLLAQRWWTLALRGAAGILFGVLTFIDPRVSLFTLVLLFGAFALVNGGSNLVMAFQGPRGEQRWGSLAFSGVASIAAGVLTFLWPGLTALVLLYIVAVWAIVTGLAEVVAAIHLRKHIRREWLLALTGSLSVVFGVALTIWPGFGALAMTLWIGAYAFAFGVLLLILGLRLRSWGRSINRQAPTGGVPTPA